MPLLGLTSAQAKLAKWIIRGAGEAVPLGLAWLTQELTSNAEAAVPLEWRRFTLTWTRDTPATTVEDRAQFKLDLVNITGDELDTTWTAGDYAAVQAAVGTFVTGILTKVAPTQHFAQLRAYRMQFSDIPDTTRPFADSGPPTYVGTQTGVGTGTGSLPYQISPTVTLRTAWPKHWGRSYMPTPGTDVLSTATGRLVISYLTQVGSAYKTMLSTLHDGGFYPVIPVGQLNKQPFHALLGVTQVVVDDIADVQRRRRPKQPAIRQVA